MHTKGRWDMLKVCRICNEEKDPNTDFYRCLGRQRSECKQCTIKNSARYQRERTTWKGRPSDAPPEKTYIQVYWANHRDKYNETQKAFLERNPGYYKKYRKPLKEKKAPSEDDAPDKLLTMNTPEYKSESNTNESNKTLNRTNQIKR